MLGFLTLPSQATFPACRRVSTRAAVSDKAPPSSLSAADRKSLYDVLRVKRNASHTEIKTAYRTLAKLYHPDATSRFMDSSIATSSSDGRDFIEIHEAYSTLSDPDARAVYDFNLNFNSRRLLKTTGFASPNRSKIYPTRRWETDQCW